MDLDRTRWCELLVGLERVEILDVRRSDDRLVVRIETTDRFVGGSGCGTRAVAKDRACVELADLAAFGSWSTSSNGGNLVPTSSTSRA